MCWDSCCGWDSSLGQICALGVSLAAQRLSKATLSDVKTLNKLVEQAKSTADMSIVIPCDVVRTWKLVPLFVAQTLVSRTLNTRSRSVV